MRLMAIIGIISALLLIYPRLQKKLKIKHWYHALDLKSHHAHYQRLFADVNGFNLSKQARATADAIEFTYGEIDFISFIALISLLKPNVDTVFYDLGSGIGTAVFACAMVFGVRKSYGIELLSILHYSATQQLLKLKESDKYKKATENIILINANFLDIDYSDADIIMINASAFFSEIWTKLSEHLRLHSRAGAIIISTSKKLCSADFILLQITTVQRSWGIVQAYIQQHK